MDIHEGIWLGLVIGAASSAHCLGMCGPFALHLAGAHGRWKVLARQLLWHCGRVTTYIFLGAIVAFFGGLLTWPARPEVQMVLTWLAGGLMIAMGLTMLGIRPWRRQRRDESSFERQGLLAGLFQQFFANPSAPAALVLGLATGFLPCGIVWSGLALSVQSGSVLTGMATMAALGFGAVPALLALGLAGSVVKASMRRRVSFIGAVFLILLGAATILRGSPAMKAILPPAYKPAIGATSTPTGSTTSPVNQSVSSDSCCQ